MAGFIEEADRGQHSLLPGSLDDWVGKDNPVRVIDAFVDGLDLKKRGFETVEPLDIERPGYHPSVHLKLYIYGYLYDAVAFALDLFGAANTNMMHPGYLGLFNPSVAFAGVVADHVTAIINPQLAVWAHAPAAVEIEAHTVRFVAELFGWPADRAMGHFTSGGSEANYTAARYTRVATGIISAIESPLEALSLPKMRDERTPNRKRKHKGRPPAK